MKNLFLALTVLSLSLLGAEGFLRWHDGFLVWRLALMPVPRETPVAAPAPPQTAAAPAAATSAPAAATPIEPEETPVHGTVAPYLEAMTVPAGVEKAWFRRSPPPPRPQPVIPKWKSHLEEVMGAGEEGYYPGKAYNRFLIDATCAHPERLRLFRAGREGRLTRIFLFDPAQSDPHPAYRLPRGGAGGGGLITNRYGWKSEEIAFDKPAGTVRIAFVGASTTIQGSDHYPAYPDLVVHWLNLWAESAGLEVRFETLNGARWGIRSQDIAAIVQEELLPLEPDLVVYYEGANQFRFTDLIHLEEADGNTEARQRLNLTEIAERERNHPLARGAAWSAILRRLFYVVKAGVGFGRPEPEKPAHVLRFPPGVDEFDPDLSHPRLPAALTDIVRDLESIRKGLKRQGGELVLSTFVWTIEPGWDLRHQPWLYEGMLRHWPATYAEIRRMADFQNRVYRTFARERGVPLLEVDAGVPRDPNLTDDGMHMPPHGVRLRAWVTFNQLLPLVRARIDGGELPRPDRAPGMANGEHPYLAPPHLVAWSPCDQRPDEAWWIAHSPEPEVDRELLRVSSGEAPPTEAVPTRAGRRHLVEIRQGGGSAWGLRILDGESGARYVAWDFKGDVPHYRRYFFAPASSMRLVFLDGNGEEASPPGGLERFSLSRLVK